jgi:hypothetical protein
MIKATSILLDFFIKIIFLYNFYVLILKINLKNIIFIYF